MTTGLRERLTRLRRGASESPGPSEAAGDGLRDADRLPGERLVREEGELRLVRTRFVAAARHGARPLGDVLARWSDRSASELGRCPDLRGVAATGLTFLDAETTGLSVGAGTQVFLVGLLRLCSDEPGAVEVDQLLLPAISQEAALTCEIHERLARSRAIVSFNGRSYDLPLLQSRAVLSRRSPLPEPPHLDLLHPARRLLSRGLPDARLQSLERRILGFERQGDLPGSEAPAAWFSWLRRGQVEPLRAVLRHNLWDLLSLTTLLATLLELVDSEPGRPSFSHDGLALAEHWARHGRPAAARTALAELAAEDRVRPREAARRTLRRARLTKRVEGPAAARGLWQQLTGRPDAGPEPWEELAKLLEHRWRDPASARRVVREALARFGRRAHVRSRLEHRLRRLERKLERRSTEG